MKNAEREKSLAYADVASDANTDRRVIFERNYGVLLDTCLESPQLFIADAERLIFGLASHLHQFTGDTDHEFIQWAGTILYPAIDRLRRFYDLKEKYYNVVRSAIWRTLGHSAEPNKLDDYPELVRELANEVWLFIFLNLDKLTNSGSAKLSTRLFGLARRHTRNWKSKQQGRMAAVRKRLAAGRGLGVETLTDAEIAELMGIQREEMAA